MLYIVATPIGNLEDITLRALRILRKVDFIICEDTRVTAKFLAHYEIKKPLVSYHHHSKLDKINNIIARLEKGENAALVSDAGTPGINDPGGILIREILKLENTHPFGCRSGQALTPLEGGAIKIIPIPGVCAAITLASVSGIAMDKFLFFGFPPHKKGRQTFFKKVCESESPVIFYESCHRILKALREIECASESIANERGVVVSENPPLPPHSAITQGRLFGKGGKLQIIVGREITKMFETIYRGNAEEIINQLENNKNNLKGEFTVIVYKTNGR